jgi:hypothetical protein
VPVVVVLKGEQVVVLFPPALVDAAAQLAA